MRNACIIPFNENESIVITSDNSGAIGLKEDDAVKVPYDVVSYYAFRVAMMECLASGAEPLSIVMQNFCGDEPWTKLVQGIEKGMEELQMELPITGSTESNFYLLQSAIGMLVIGKKKNDRNRWIPQPDRTKYAVIGSPLVGLEVIERNREVAPLHLFKEMSETEQVMTWPVGSKGILYEWGQIPEDNRLVNTPITCDVDLLKSSGPATCFLVGYSIEKEKEIIEKAGLLFHPILPIE